MAKGNLFQGMARGSVGDVTFSRLKGQQISRIRNRQPSNPRTANQMSNRTVFMDAVRFYKRGVQGLFTFAFEDKRANESDYNAFMRYNAKNGIYVTKADGEDASYPAVGNWILTQGTLSGVGSVVADAATYVVTLNAPAPAEAPTTIGALSQALINGGYYMQGDILTWVQIISSSISGAEAEPILPAEEPFAPAWIIQQRAVDVDSTETLQSLGITYSAVEGKIVLTFAGQSDTIGGFAFIQSRLGAKLRVSNATIANNVEAANAIQFGQSAVWRDIVLASWDSREEAILEGALIP